VTRKSLKALLEMHFRHAAKQPAVVDLSHQEAGAKAIFL
jgi:hypothetical protein